MQTQTTDLWTPWGKAEGDELRKQYGSIHMATWPTEPAGTPERHRELNPALRGP